MLDKEDLVYKTSSGKSYHTHKNCQYIKGKTQIEVKFSEVEKHNLTYCKICKAKDENKKIN